MSHIDIDAMETVQPTQERNIRAPKKLLLFLRPA